MTIPNKSFDELIRDCIDKDIQLSYWQRQFFQEHWSRSRRFFPITGRAELPETASFGEIGVLVPDFVGIDEAKDLSETIYQIVSAGKEPIILFNGRTIEELQNWLETGVLPE